MKKKLKDICNGFTKNIAQKELDELNGDYEIYGASGLIKKIDYYVSEVPYIGIVKDGSGVGRVSSYPAKSSLIGTMQYIVPNNDIDLQYLMYALRSMNLGNLFKGAAIPHIYFKEYKEFNVNVPSLPEQQKIAAHLDSIQSAIDNKKQQLQQLDELVKSKFVEMFGDLAVEKDKWNTKVLTSICSSIIGGGTPSKSHAEYYEGNIPWVTSKDMKSFFIEDSKDHINQNAIDNSSAKLIDRNSVIMVVRSGILKHTLPVAINKCEVTINQDLKAFIPNSKINSYYLAVYFKNIEEEILNGVRCVTADNIDFQTFLMRKIPVPPIELQNTFAEYVQKIDSAKSIIKTQLNDLNELLESKMDFYFGE